MAENILGLLLVTTTSRDRYVFPYPPDPTSPEARLQQPVYSRATYTAKDSTVDHKSHRLFPRHRSDGSRGSGSRGLNTTTHFWSSKASSHKAVASRTGRDDGSATSSMAAPASTGSFHSHLTEVGSDRSDSSSSSDDSDFDRLFDSGYARNNAPRRYSSDTDASTPVSVRPNAPRPFTEIVTEGRRGSVVESESTARAGGSKRGGTTGKNAFVEAQYNYALGYSLDFLGDLLSPPRAACNRKFEVCVDELVFIGHPVCNTPDGKWSYRSSDSDDEDDARLSRGRRMNDTPATRDASLRPVAEHPESPRTRFERLQDSSLSLTSLHRDALNTSTASLAASLSTVDLAGANARSNGKKDKDKEDDTPSLNMFHLVLIIDKPDPRPDGEAHLAEVFDHLYREIAFKWTAAAFALQQSSNWVATEIQELVSIREKAIAEGVPVVDCLRKCVEKSELAQSLHELFSALHKIKGKPLNTHFTAMPTTLAINVGSMPISIAVPPRQLTAEGTVMLDNSDSSDDSSDDEWALVTGPDGIRFGKQPHLSVEPWQTLLMLQEDEDAVASMVAVRESGRRNSKSQQEEDELQANLIRACDITKPLHEIAHMLRYDLDGIVIPLARELVQSRRAILVDVVNIRLRTILLPTSISDHLRSLTQHCVRWNVLFPKLPPLVPLIAQISMKPVPFRDLLPHEAQVDATKRDVYIRAVAWLLRNDLVQQARVRARVVASPAVKEAAWKRMWHRRRKKWLRERAASMTSKGSTGSRGSRPSFGAAGMSLSSSHMVPPSTSSSNTIISPKSDSLITPRPTETNPMDVAFASRVPRLNNVPPTPMGTAEFPRTATNDSYLDYDSDLEMDSDLEGEGDCAIGEEQDREREKIAMFGEFTVEQDEPSPSVVPTFHGSFIFNPGQAQKDEARWLRVIREHHSDPVLQSRFDLCVQYFNGVTTFEEIMYRTSLSRRELDRIAHEYRDDLMLTVQP